MLKGKRVGHDYGSAYEDNLKRFEDLNMRFKSLHQEVRFIHEKWGKLKQTKDEDHIQSELINLESQILEELQQLLDSADEVMRRHLQKLRYVKIVGRN